MEFFEVIDKRRTVRDFEKEEIPQEIRMLQLLLFRY